MVFLSTIPRPHPVYKMNFLSKTMYVFIISPILIEKCEVVKKNLSIKHTKKVYVSKSWARLKSHQWVRGCECRTEVSSSTDMWSGFFSLFIYFALMIIQMTLVIPTAFVPEDSAVKTNLPLYRIPTCTRMINDKKLFFPLFTARRF